MIKFRQLYEDQNLENEFALEKKLKAHYDSEEGKKSLESYTRKSYDINNYHWQNHGGEATKSFRKVSPWHSALASREYEPDELKHIGKVTSELDRETTKYRTPQAFTVWSKTVHDPNQIKDENNLVHHPAFLSTTIKRRNVFHDFAARNQVNGQNHIMKINIPENSPGRFVSDKHNYDNRAKEFILPRNSILEHHHTEQHGDDFIHHMTFHGVKNERQT